MSENLAWNDSNIFSCIKEKLQGSGLSKRIDKARYKKTCMMKLNKVGYHIAFFRGLGNR